MASARGEQAGALVSALVGLMRAGRSLATRAGMERRATSTATAVLKAVNANCTRPSDIAAELQIDLSVVSRAVALLDTEGLIARTLDPRDARAQVLSITDAGREQVELLHRIYVQMASELLSEWTPAEIGEAVRVLDRLSETLRGEHADDLHDRLARAAAAATSAQGSNANHVADTGDPTPTDASGPERQRRRPLATTA